MQAESLAALTGLRRWRQEIPLVLGIFTAALQLVHWSPAGSAAGLPKVFWASWVLVCIVLCAVRAMSAAEVLAKHFGEPGGTIILTGSAIIIEVATLTAMMLSVKPDDPLARDTMFAVLMLTLNLLTGLAIVVGGFRKKIQDFNPASISNYLPFIFSLATITLILPHFTHTAQGGYMSVPMEVFTGVSSLIIFLLFLAMQTSGSSEFFSRSPERGVRMLEIGKRQSLPALRATLVMLTLALLIVVVLADFVGSTITGFLQSSHWPPSLSGIFIAILVLAPEGLSALQASRNSDMQRSMNILLGSALASIGLTVPAVLVVSYFTGVSPEFGLEPPYIVLLILTFFVLMGNLALGRVNMLQGLVHLLLFVTWIMVIFDEFVFLRPVLG